MNIPSEDERLPRFIIQPRLGFLEFLPDQDNTRAVLTDIDKGWYGFRVTETRDVRVAREIAFPAGVSERCGIALKGTATAPREIRNLCTS